MDRKRAPAKREGDLSVTALYTSATWSWAGFPCAELFALPEARAVFNVTNIALALFKPGWAGHPSLRHSLAQRHAMIDRLVGASGARRVVEVAAGLSRRGATMSADPRIDYTEIDLPPIIERKGTLLSRTEEGRAVLARANLHLVAGDARTLDLGALVPPTERAALVAEGLCMYLGAEAQRALFRRAADALAAGGVFVFDLVPVVEQAPPGWTGRLLEKLMKKATGGRAFERDARDREQIISELRAAGFDEVAVHEGRRVAAQWGLPFPKARTHVVVFESKRG